MYRTSKSTISAIVAVNLLLAVVAYFVLFPLIAPETASSALADAYAWRFALVVLGAGVVASLLVTSLVSLLFKPDHSLQEAIDAIRQPVLLVDGDNRYAHINREAESTLGLSRERDVGKALDHRLVAAMSTPQADPNLLNLSSVVSLNDTHYQVIDNPLATPDDGRRHRLIILREIDSLVKLRDAVREIGQTMVILNSNTMKISASAVSLSQGATEQASSLSSITSSMDEFNKKIQGNTESAAKSTQLAAQAREAAERSGNEIAHALTAMNDVQDAGIRIARIVKLIDDIAFQTNLLALNAAVEAARAGRQGKGFAVVADEVRNLAGRSAKAAKDTASMVEDVTERIGNASAYISKLEEMLHNIVQDAIRMADSAAAASTTSAEQASGILEVNHELNQMNSVTQNTMEAAEQTATAVEVLARQVNMLKGKLDELAKDFSFDGVAPDWNKPADRINLLDDPGKFSPSKPTHSYLSDSYREFMRENGRSTEDGDGQKAANDWNLDDASDSADDPLASLLKADGYADSYRDFLESSTKPLNDLNATLFSTDGATPEIRTPDGDRVVKPNQNIHLDDSEFGRY